MFVGDHQLSKEASATVFCEGECCSYQVSDRYCQGKTDGLPNEGLESWLSLVRTKIA